MRRLSKWEGKGGAGRDLAWSGGDHSEEAVKCGGEREFTSRTAEEQQTSRAWS